MEVAQGGRTSHDSKKRSRKDFGGPSSSSYEKYPKKPKFHHQQQQQHLSQYNQQQYGHHHAAPSHHVPLPTPPSKLIIPIFVFNQQLTYDKKIIIQIVFRNYAIYVRDTFFHALASYNIEPVIQNSDEDDFLSALDRALQKGVKYTIFVKAKNEVEQSVSFRAIHSDGTTPGMKFCIHFTLCRICRYAHF